MIQEIWSKVWRFILRYSMLFTSSFFIFVGILLGYYSFKMFLISTVSLWSLFFSGSPSLFLYLLELAIPQRLVLCIFIKRYIKRHKLRVHLLIVLFNSLAVKIKCKACTDLIQNTHLHSTHTPHLHVQYLLYLSNKYKGLHKGLVFGRFKVKLFRNGQGAKKDLEIEMTTFTWPSWRGKVKPEWLFYTGAFQTSSPVAPEQKEESG